MIFQRKQRNRAGRTADAQPEQEPAASASLDTGGSSAQSKQEEKTGQSYWIRKTEPPPGHACGGRAKVPATIEQHKQQQQHEKEVHEEEPNLVRWNEYSMKHVDLPTMIWTD